VQISETRQIKSVLVKVGDMVQAGQVLFELEDAESDELQALIAELETMKINYQIKILQNMPDDYVDAINDINDMKNDLAKLKSDRSKAVAYQAEYDRAKASEAMARAQVDGLSSQIDDIQNQIDDIELGVASRNPTISALAAQLNSAKAALASAQSELSYWQSEEARIRQLIGALEDPESDPALNDQLYIATMNINQYQQMVNDYTLEVSRLQSSFDQQKSSLTTSLIGYLNSLKTSKSQADKALLEAQKAVEEASRNLTTTVEQYDEQIKNLERQIAKAQTALAEQQKDASIQQQIIQLGLEQDKKAIEDKEAEIERLRGQGIGSQVTARYAGTISSVNVVAGDTASPGITLAGIDVEGKGYTLSFSVTNEQAKQVHVGDKASVIDYWWGNVDVTLTAIKTDRENPGSNKILEFSITGDVVEGQTLNLAVGERQTAYDIVVPNSAIREDSNGTFILIAKAKSTPLGNRYIATRVDVSVIAKDAYNTAIEANSEYGYEYVITTSTKPLEGGMQVRLVDAT
jgi:multidrug resistance efflux pump